jgi:hypothetical protein
VGTIYSAAMDERNVKTVATYSEVSKSIQLAKNVRGVKSVKSFLKSTK